jgi:hypothetical protein
VTAKKSTSKKSTARKSASKARTPKAPSPMQKANHVAGPNVDGMAAQARAAHEIPGAVPPAVAATEAPMNTPLPPSESAVDSGKE